MKNEKRIDEVDIAKGIKRNRSLSKNDDRRIIEL